MKAQETKLAGSAPALDGLLGLAVGDALGVPYEFSWREKLKKNPATDMIGYGTYNQPEGSWSDDTAMALCTADSMVKGFNPDDMMKKFSAWTSRSQYTATGVRFDIGMTCRRAIELYEQGLDPSECGDYSEMGNGNGGLMRIYPVALWQSLKAPRGQADTEEFLRPVHIASSLTHGHERGLICCGIYTMMLDEWMHRKEGDTPLEAFSRGFERAKALYTRMGGTFEREMNEPGLFLHPQTLIGTPESALDSSGYVMHTLHAALWCLLTTDSYRACVLKAVNMGRDTDTTAAVAGAMAGVIYGREAIPADWLEKLKNRKLVEDIANRLDAAICGRKEEKLCIDSFTGEYAHMAMKVAARIEIDGVIYGNLQAAYLAQSVDQAERAQFAVLTAHQARRLAGQLAQRAEWEEERFETLERVCMQKYAQNPELRVKLLLTGEMEIIYDTTGAHDNEMGRCGCEACMKAGAENRYGKTLMRVRERLSRSK